MIERHYFKGRLIKSFDFTFPFCIPKSTNTWTSEYELPPMDAALGMWLSMLLRTVHNKVSLLIFVFLDLMSAELILVTWFSQLTRL